MTPRDFCFWLQGFFELEGATPIVLEDIQLDLIKKHLQSVFDNEICSPKEPHTVTVEMGDGSVFDLETVGGVKNVFVKDPLKPIC